MDAFESLISMLLKREGYWTTTSFRVALSRDQKRAIQRPTSPRWELDVVAYRGADNEVLAVECKSYLDSEGVVYRNGTFEPPETYKLFTDANLRQVVLAALADQLVSSKSCHPSPSVTLCLAAGHLSPRTDPASLASDFAKQGWRLFDANWIFERLNEAASSSYENDVAHVVAKLFVRRTDNAK